MAETEKERVDRELIELLNEIRVALPGVQVLFAFLLILPFTDGFGRATELERYVYFGTLIATAAATALLIAPSSIHRIRFRDPAKDEILFTSNRLLIAGTVLVAVAVTGTVFLIGDVLFGLGPAGLIAALTAGWFAWFWYGLPVFQQSRSDQREPGAAPGARAEQESR